MPTLSSDLAGILSVLVGLCSCIYLHSSLIRWRTSQNWPTTAATILESGLAEDSDGYIPCVAYEYTVEGKLYTNNRLYFHLCNGSSELAAIKHLSAYPVGKRVSVYYNVRNPSDSVLDRHMPLWLPIFWLFFALFFIVMGIFFCCLTTRLRKIFQKTISDITQRIAFWSNRRTYGMWPKSRVWRQG